MSQHTQTTLTGRFQGSERGFGFFLPEGGGQDLFVPPRQTLGAWDGDRVEAVPAGEDPRRPGSPPATSRSSLCGSWRTPSGSTGCSSP